jgi:hypothetical protein
MFIINMDIVFFKVTVLVFCSFSYWVAYFFFNLEQFLEHFGYESFVRYMNCKYYFSVLWLRFCLS